MRAEVAGPSPSPLESLQAGRVVACWVQVAYCDAAATRVGDASVKQAEHARKRQDSAHRRYVTAIGALATVRKLVGAAGSPSDALPPGRSRMMFSGDEEVEAHTEVGAVRLAIQDVDEGCP